jgi:ABC-type uncharacterized transport system permease subunit
VSSEKNSLFLNLTTQDSTLLKDILPMIRITTSNRYNITPLRSFITNICAEGQLLMGAIFATWTAQHLGNALPSALIVPLIFTAGFIGGALWGIIPAILKI